MTVDAGESHLAEHDRSAYRPADYSRIIKNYHSSDREHQVYGGFWCVQRRPRSVAINSCVVGCGVGVRGWFSPKVRK
jgi:hypothetical protein